MRRSNPERSAATRASLLDAATELFARDGFTGTSTDQILATTGMTRGALYHHFRDKTDLFAEVCEQLHAEAGGAIEDAVEKTIADRGSSLDVLRAGCEAWLDFVSRPGTYQILVVDAPSTLGWDRWQELDSRHGYATLIEGVRKAQVEELLTDRIPAARLAQFLNGAMNQAVLTIGTDPGSLADLLTDVNSLIDVLSTLPRK